MTMSASGLSVEQAPPHSVPLRFFLTAPLFGIIAAGILVYAGPDAFASRWTLPVLAATHGLTLGVITMVICGAMLQLLPVLFGVRVPWTDGIATLVHLTLVPGVLSLVATFMDESGRLLPVTIMLLTVSFTVFIGAAGVALLRSPVRSATARSMRFALAALTVTAAFGITLLFGRYTPGIGINLQSLHPLWGIAGWVGLMIIGVAYQVVPMFQFTADYPGSLQRFLASAVITLLLLVSTAVLSDLSSYTMALVVMLLSALSIFGVITLRLQARRRRPLADVTLRYWRFGLLCGLLAAAGVAASWLFPETVHRPEFALVIGILLLHGFAISLITGMLYKIVPFLLWLDLHSRLSASVEHRRLPSMKTFISESAARRQSYLHWSALVLLIAAAVMPHIIRGAALILGLSYAVLWLNLVIALRRYRRLSESEVH